jgi:hypothetical protein
MLPGNFTWLLLQIANFINLAAGESFLETADVGVREGAAGGVVFRAGWRNGGGCLLAGFPMGHVQSQGAAKYFANRTGELGVAEIERVRFGGRDLKIGAGNQDARIFDSIGKMSEALAGQMAMETLAGVVRVRGDGGRGSWSGWRQSAAP